MRLPPLLALGLVLWPMPLSAQVPPGSPPAQEDPTFRNPLFADEPKTPAAGAPTGLDLNPAEPPAATDRAGESDSGGQPTMLRMDLDDQAPVPVPTSMIRTTTIVFPFPIEDLHGTGFTPNPAKIKGDFFVAARPGANYLSITPLVEGARRNLNIIAKGRVYSLDVYPAQPRGAAAFSVVLRLPGGGPGREQVRAESTETSPAESLSEPSRSLSRPPSQGRSAGPARVLGVLDSLKLLAGLGDAEAARKAAALMPDVQFVARPGGEVQEIEALRIELSHTLRNARLDALAFAVRLTNTGRTPLAIDRSSFAVRAGDPLQGPRFEAVTADVDPVLPPGETRRAFFVVVGGAVQGSRNLLEPEKNRFYITCVATPAGPGAAPVVKKSKKASPSKP